MSRGLLTFLDDTRAVDTIPLKMIVYIAITCIIMILAATSWNNTAPVIKNVQVDEQMGDAALKIKSIQKGAARDLLNARSPDGNICIVDLSLPEDILYVSFGVDPDPDGDGDIENSGWMTSNNTITYQYGNGVKKYVFIKGDTISFRQGYLNDEGIWVMQNETGNGHEKGVVIEGPVDGEFVFELVSEREMYTLSHF